MDYVARLCVERNELEARLVKLETFIKGETFGKLDERNRDLLTLQREYMAQYLGVLNERIRLTTYLGLG